MLKLWPIQSLRLCVPVGGFLSLHTLGTCLFGGEQDGGNDDADDDDDDNYIEKKQDQKTYEGDIFISEVMQPQNQTSNSHGKCGSDEINWRFWGYRAHGRAPEAGYANCEGIKMTCARAVAASKNLTIPVEKSTTASRS